MSVRRERFSRQKDILSGIEKGGRRKNSRALNFEAFAIQNAVHGQVTVKLGGPIS